ncbi:MAG TPA: hypothetical protein VKY19_24035 [Ktedonosporobacter sp.]|jgi:catechol 2,3-dioxygenase-like lactoylglutathione lyase family enzyme|nr:hypothetical protein [Ktedonosporobacter sp.]
MSTASDKIFQGEQVSQQGEKTSLCGRLIPIIFVDDPDAERDFYLRLGFTCQQTEFPDLIAVSQGSIEFGIERGKGFTQLMPDRVVTWRLCVSDIDVAKNLLTNAGVRFREEWVMPRQDWKYRVLHVRTPNGYHLFLEGAPQ